MAGKNKYKLTRKKRARLSKAERADVGLVRWLAPAIRSPLGKLVGAFGRLADEPPLMVLSAAVAATGLARRDRRLARTGVRMMAAHALAVAIKDFGKARVTRSRPDALLCSKTYRMEAGGSPEHDLQSFPSGHSAGAVALARAAARDYPMPRTFYGGAAALGAAQLFRRAHFAGDVLVGAVAGLVAEAVSHALLGRILRREAPPEGHTAIPALS